MKINENLLTIYKGKKFVSAHMLDTVMQDIAESQKRLDRELLERHLVTEEINAVVYAELFDMDYAKASEMSYDTDVVTKVSKAFINRYLTIPIRMEEGRMVFALSDPFNYELAARMQAIAQGPYKAYVSSAKEIHSLKNLVFSRTSTTEALTNLENQEVKKGRKISGSDEEANQIDIDNAPTVRLTDSIIREAIARGASDIHFEPYKDHIRVRYRIDGELQEVANFDVEMYSAVLTRIKIISGINIAKKRVPQDGRIRQRFNDREYDFRVSTLPTAFGERIVIRILDTEAFTFDRPQLGFLPSEDHKIDYMLRQPHGIILLVGPTGSGKTTTLYSFLRELNTVNRNIVTVEDPIEYTIKGVGQVQVNPQAKLTFASALRSILRQDPDTIMIGEIRDEETANIAVRAAITGHLVFSTLHTNDAAGSVTRLIDMDVEPYFVADAVIAVVAQRLIRRVCLQCRAPIETTPAEMKMLKVDEPHKIYKANGCPACAQTGYKGRLGIHEILVMDDEIRELVFKHASHDSIKQHAIKKGMLTLLETAKLAVLKGISTMQELHRIAFESEEFVEDEEVKEKDMPDAN